MKRLLGFFVSLLGSSILMVGVAANPAIAQDKKAEKAAPQVQFKVFSENDKVKVYEATYVPGAENPSPPYPMTRVVRALTNGTLERRYADGKIEKVEWKQGMVQVLPPSGAYTNKNIGKTTLRLYVVVLK